MDPTTHAARNGPAIVYDYGERRSGIPDRLAHLGLETEPRRLGVADYLLSDRLAVIRLTESSLVEALRGGRLFERINALRREYPLVVLIVQQAPQPPLRGQRTALSWVLRAGISVLFVDESEDAATWIARLAAQEAGAAPPTAAVGIESTDPDRLLEQLVAWLPGVSTLGARRLLAHFGSLRDLFGADEAEIMRVRGFGPRRSAEIARIARHRYRPGPPEGYRPAPPQGRRPPAHPAAGLTRLRPSHRRSRRPRRP